jgi:hypothetical protein
MMSDERRKRSDFVREAFFEGENIYDDSANVKQRDGGFEGGE